jgi:class 3 adenylate cyclase/tetratricopeptide (TPR) repeat protein
MEPGLPADLKDWLSGIGLGHQADSFAANGVDWDVLCELTEADLRELGLSLGDRKRLLRAIAGLSDHRSVAAVPETAQPGETSVRGDATATAPGERRPITVMFVDLVGSTPMSEKLDPEDMRDVLRVFHESSAAAIEAEDGHIARYMGDGVLVYFGYPRAHEDDAARAVRSGLAIVDRLEAANVSLGERYTVRLQVRVGIHTGLVVIGDIGAGSSRDREAIVGETPNIAARLQGEAEPDTIVVSAATRRLIEGQFTFEDFGSRALKGVSSLIRVFRVLGPAQSADRFGIRAERGLTPLIGRAGELDILSQRWEQARDGEMRCVMLVGEAGIGKSRIVHAFREHLAGEPHHVVTWLCSSHHRNSAFFPIVAWFCHSIGIDPQGDRAGGAAKLAEAAKGLGIDGKSVASVAMLLGVATGGPEAAQDTSGLVYRRKLLDALALTIQAMVQRQPLILVVEDAHWADPSTLELVRELQERLSAFRLMLLLTARPEFRPDWHFPQLVQVNLDRLSRRERQAMIGELTGGKTLPEFVLDEIVARTDGVPLFVEELTRTVLEGNSWRETGTRYELEGSFQGIAIPDSLQGSLLARLDRLEPAARQIAQIGATIGREFDRALVRIVARLEDEVLDGGLEQLVAAEIVRPVWLAIRGKAFSFRHALIQDAAYQSLLLARRREYHAALGQALIDDFPELAAAQPELVAHHLTAADQPDPAIDAWLRAGHSAMARGAYAEARVHVSRGLELIRRLPDPAVRTRRAVSFLLIRGRLEIKEARSKAQSTLYRAASLAREAGLAHEFARSAVSMCIVEQFGFSKVPLATDLLREALDHPAIVDPVERCHLLARLAVSHMRRGEFEQSLRLPAEVRETAERLGDLVSLTLGIGNYLVINPPVGAAGLEERRQLIQRYAVLARENLDPFEAIYASGLASSRFLEIGDIDSHLLLQKSVAEFARMTQAPSDRWLTLGFQAMSATLEGDYALAERKAEEAYAVVGDTGFVPALGIHGMQMFAIRRDQGRLAEVAPLVRRFVAESPEEAVWKPGLMLVASDLGFSAQARKHFEGFADRNFEVADDAKRVITLTYFAEVCAALGDAENAGRLVELLEPYRDLCVMVPPHTLCCGSTRHYLGVLTTTMKDWAAAEEHFRAALVMNERIRAWPRLAWTRFEYARMLLARGHDGDSMLCAELRQMAVAAAERLGMGNLLQRNAIADWRG